MPIGRLPLASGLPSRSLPSRSGKAGVPTDPVARLKAKLDNGKQPPSRIDRLREELNSGKDVGKSAAHVGVVARPMNQNVIARPQEQNLSHSLEKKREELNGKGTSVARLGQEIQTSQQTTSVARLGEEIRDANRSAGQSTSVARLGEEPEQGNASSVARLGKDNQIGDLG